MVLLIMGLLLTFMALMVVSHYLAKSATEEFNKKFKVIRVNGTVVDPEKQDVLDLILNNNEDICVVKRK